VSDKLLISIRKNDTGEVRQYEGDFGPWEEHSDYIWTDGNYGCDCNRANFFVRAGGGIVHDILAAPCGDGAYSIKVEDAATHEVRVNEL